MPDGVEWSLVMVTEDLCSETRLLEDIADEFRFQAKSWTHPAARAHLSRMAVDISNWSQEAATESTRGDFSTRMEALQLAINRRRAASSTLQEWWEKSQLYNANRIRPVPQTVRNMGAAKWVEER